MMNESDITPASQAQLPPYSAFPNVPESQPVYRAQQPNQNQQTSMNNQQMPQQTVPITNFYQPVISYSDIRRHYLKENFPAGYAVFHLIFMIFMAFSLIGIQVELIYKESYLSELGGGFISGGALLLTTIITIISISYRGFCIIVTSIVFHLISLITVFACQIVLSLIVIVKGDCLSNIDSCKTDLIFLSNVAMISIGIICSIMCLVYFIAIQVGVVNKAAKLRNNVLNGFTNQNYLN